jgi:YebC/PmpR family DNA-binding regulatory protein
MSGHSKWKQIKHKKALADQGRGELFSKLSKAISAAAKDNPDPKFNSTLRSTIEQARRQNMPQANIERAIERAGEAGDQEELLLEVYGPEGIGILVGVVTDNRNRSVAEIRAILKDHGLKIADPGSLTWAFEKAGGEYKARFPSQSSVEAREAVAALAAQLKQRNDVVGLYSSCA